jgi:repressor LexA
MTKLTARQQEVFDLIRRAIERTGFPPTRAEIAAELGFSSANSAEEHLRALARKGVIEHPAAAGRSGRRAASVHAAARQHHAVVAAPDRPGGRG